MHQTLIAAAEELRANYLTGAIISSLTDFYTPLVRPIDQAELPAGSWYYRVLARTSYPMLYQVARNALSEGGQSYLEVRRFTLP